MNDFYKDIKSHKNDIVDNNTPYRGLQENIEMLEKMRELHGNDDTDLFFNQVLHDTLVYIQCLIDNKSLLIRR